MTIDPNARAAVDVARLGYAFAGSRHAAVQDLSFALRPGSFTVIAGRSGAGKSTLLRALAGLIPRHAAGEMQGDVTLYGLNTRTAPPPQLARHAGLVLQSPDDQLCASSVEAEVSFGLENLCLPADQIGPCVERWLACLGLAGRQWQPTSTLSSGQKQRLMIASVLAMGPRVLLLDEPLAQLDPPGARDLVERLAALAADGITVVVAEHRLHDLLPRADRLLVLDAGRLVADLATENPVDVAGALAAAGLTAPQTSPAIAPGAADGPALVSVVDLAYRFAAPAPPLWEGIEFSLRAGECVALVGVNGAGKSTLLHVLAGLLAPAQGQVEWNGDALDRARVGLVPQNPDLALFCRTVGDELEFGPLQLGVDRRDSRRRAAALAAAFDLLLFLDEPPLALSQGQRLRAAIAAALSPSPRVLLLDEPTTGQDPPQVARVMAAIRNLVAQRAECGAVLFATHDLRVVAQFADRVLVLGGGRLLADCSPDRLVQDQDLLCRAGLRAGTSDVRGEPSAALPLDNGVASQESRV